jgi:DNA-binding XRE family transcriptional regulator
MGDIMDNITFKEKQKYLGYTNKTMAEQLGFSEKHIEQMRSGYKSIARHTVLLIKALCQLKEKDND